MLLVKEKEANLDEYFEKAIKECAPYDAVSASFLQRRLVIGYARAVRLLDQLEEAGIVSPAHGLEPRRVLILKNKTSPKKGVKLDTNNFLLANAQLITTLLAEHNIAVKLVRITVQKENILFLFDFDIRAKIDDILKLDKEIAAIFRIANWKGGNGSSLHRHVTSIYLFAYKEKNERRNLSCFRY